MDQESPDFYKEETQQSISDTRRYSSSLLNLFSSLNLFFPLCISFIQFVREMKVNCICVYVLNLAIVYVGQSVHTDDLFSIELFFPESPCSSDHHTSLCSHLFKEIA